MESSAGRGFHGTRVGSTTHVGCGFQGTWVPWDVGRFQGTWVPRGVWVPWNTWVPWDVGSMERTTPHLDPVYERAVRRQIFKNALSWMAMGSAGAARTTTAHTRTHTHTHTHRHIHTHAHTHTRAYTHHIRLAIGIHLCTLDGVSCVCCTPRRHGIHIVGWLLYIARGASD